MPANMSSGLPLFFFFLSLPELEDGPGSCAVFCSGSESVSFVFSLISASAVLRAICVVKRHSFAALAGVMPSLLTSSMVSRSSAGRPSRCIRFTALSMSSAMEAGMPFFTSPKTSSSAFCSTGESLTWPGAGSPSCRPEDSGDMGPFLLYRCSRPFGAAPGVRSIFFSPSLGPLGSFRPSGWVAYLRVREQAYSGRGNVAGRRASVWAKAADSSSWRDDRARCAGRRRMLVMMGVAGGFG